MALLSGKLWLCCTLVKPELNCTKYSWNIASIVGSITVNICSRQYPGFDLPRQQWSLLNRFRMEQGHEVPAEGNGDLQTLICVLVVRPRRCLTLSNPVPWQNWMAAYLGYTLRMKTLFHGWPVMVHDTHTRRRSVQLNYLSCTTPFLKYVASNNGTILKSWLGVKRSRSIDYVRVIIGIL